MFLQLGRLSTTVSNPLRSVYKQTMKRQINTTVKLTETETKLSTLLVEFCNDYNSDKLEDQKLELRITGGWVRDKLLGDESNDLDIAINHLLGEEFAGKLLEYASLKHPDLQLKGVHTIKKNPEKSKHLETCTTKLFGLDVDFVNLRSEKYTSDSRVPLIECGTAEEDSLRRDATLNALFYNLNKEQVEDLTGRGLRDLEHGVLRTPLQPLQTFLDDPLRVLRLIRFASRFNFTVEKETLVAMADNEIKATLLHKISRERIGVELEKTLASPHPAYGVHLINYVGLTDSIFSFGVLGPELPKFNSEEDIEKVKALQVEVIKEIDVSTGFWPTFVQSIGNASGSFASNVREILHNKHLQKLLWLSIILHPYGDKKIKGSAKKMGLISVIDLILKEGLRIGKTDFEQVSRAIRLASLADNTIRAFFRAPESILRSQLGLYLMESGSYVGLNLAVQCFLDMLPYVEFEEFQSTPLPELQSTVKPGTIEVFNLILTKYEGLIKAIKDMGLEDVHVTFKPIVDGKVLQKELGRKPGPWLKPVNDAVVVWQLDNPEGTKEQCLEHIKSIMHQYE